VNLIHPDRGNFVAEHHCAGGWRKMLRAEATPGYRDAAVFQVAAAIARRRSGELASVVSQQEMTYSRALILNCI